MEPTEFLSDMDNPIAFLSRLGDTVHMHQAIKHPDKEHLINTMIKEVLTHKWHKHLKIQRISAVPENAKKTMHWHRRVAVMRRGKSPMVSRKIIALATWRHVAQQLYGPIYASY